MTDPVFKDRAELEAWRRRMTFGIGLCPVAYRQQVSATIKRVEAAHSHLFEEGK